MIADIVQKTLQITDGKDGWVGLHEKKNKSPKAFLADELIRLIKWHELSWIVSNSNDLAFCQKNEFVLVIVRSGNINLNSQCIGGTVDRYTLTLFRDSKQVLSFSEICDNPRYDSHSSRLPIMDLYDVATTESVRRPNTAHVCGSYGFGQSLDDVCPACEEVAEKRSCA